MICSLITNGQSQHCSTQNCIHAVITALNKAIKQKQKGICCWILTVYCELGKLLQEAIFPLQFLLRTAFSRPEGVRLRWLKAGFIWKPAFTWQFLKQLSQAYAHLRILGGGRGGDLIARKTLHARDYMMPVNALKSQ